MAGESEQDGDNPPTTEKRNINKHNIDIKHSPT